MADDEQQDTKVARNVRGIHERRHRLFIYRAGMSRLGAEIERGVQPAQAVWRTACELTEAFDLDSRASGLLAGCLVVAVRQR